ncbi:aspartate/glutamate racemase family protein [Bacillus sp. S/N-304-OC-R1]|uniref:aspartate/glutamate racemase family protein n=1 Tax=Bacillus sp. S/N-304-OC-R1 TaxID=2758034 RepID=UPI001C8F0222|nr:amino acid racemase [Bacillus sp. S/N-304-OC-R1]MBY0121235.1 aspartate/glutamate racemase family protein [Bacillus sp. S/N-304-OC-R1]
MGKKSLGVIGGMGPMATSVFFEKVIENTVANCDQEHINMVILNHATLPDRTSVILENKEELFLNAVEKDFRLLEAAGVEHIAIPCNTSHFFYDQMQEMSKIKIINMVDETCKEIHKKHGDHSKVAILATNGTVQSGIYKQGCKNYNMELYTPNQVSQEQVMNTIYNIKSDLHIDEAVIEQIIKDLVFKENCCCVILACTELSCLSLNAEVMKYCIDAMDVLVEKSIEYSGGIVKNPIKLGKP